MGDEDRYTRGQSLSDRCQPSLAEERLVFQETPICGSPDSPQRNSTAHPNGCRKETIASIPLEELAIEIMRGLKESCAREAIQCTKQGMSDKGAFGSAVALPLCKPVRDFKRVRFRKDYNESFRALRQA